MQEKDHNNTEAQRPGDKSPYKSPGVVEYGSITSLTRNSNMGSCPDAHDRQNMQCNDKK